MIPLLFLTVLSFVPQADKAPTADRMPKAAIISCGPWGHYLAQAPKADSGLWLDEKGQPSATITALGMLVWAGEGSGMRNGAQRRDVRRGCKALLVLVAKPGWAKQAKALRFHDEALIALALFVHARISNHLVLHCHIQRDLAGVFSSTGLAELFPETGPVDVSEDRTRLLYLFLWKQIQISRASHPLGQTRKVQTPEIPKMDADPMRLWLKRSLEEKSSGPERLLLLFFGQLILDPPKEHPLSAGITGLLWKRAHSAMALALAKTGERPKARLLFLDTLLRNEFMTHAFPKKLRESRKSRISKWDEDLRKEMPKRKGLSEGDLHRLMTLPFIYNYARWWE